MKLLGIGDLPAMPVVQWISLLDGATCAGAMIVHSPMLSMIPRSNDDRQTVEVLAC
jgi:hypothetical protein